MATFTCIKDLQDEARRRVPKMFYDYLDSGALSEQTYHANTTDFQKILLRQRVAKDITHRSTQTSMLGTPVTMPAALAPVGMSGMHHANGEILAALAAKAFGIPFTLSTISICSIEDIAEATGAPFWFQLYVMRDRAFMKQLINRAKNANCSALVVTLDLQVLAQRHKDIKNGLSTPPKPTLKNLINLARHPKWCWRMLGAKRRNFGNIVGHVSGVEDISSFASWAQNQFDPSLTWEDLLWIKEQWDGPIVAKGIMDSHDAEKALQAGVEAIVVSNHGGRQLDGAPSTISVLSQIVDTVAGRAEVWLDGGIRGGQDILRACALGARSTMIGRAFVYGLGAAGHAGVTRALEILQGELSVTMGLCGKTRMEDIDQSVLARVPPPPFTTVP